MKNIACLATDRERFDQPIYAGYENYTNQFFSLFMIISTLFYRMGRQRQRVVSPALNMKLLTRRPPNWATESSQMYQVHQQ